MAAVVDLIDVQVSIGQQGAEQVAEPCVLHNDKKISWNVINMNRWGKKTKTTAFVPLVTSVQAPSKLTMLRCEPRWMRILSSETRLARAARSA